MKGEKTNGAARSVHTRAYLNRKYRREERTFYELCLRSKGKWKCVPFLAWIFRIFACEKNGLWIEINIHLSHRPNETRRLREPSSSPPAPTRKSARSPAESWSSWCSRATLRGVSCRFGASWQGVDNILPQKCGKEG